MDNSTVFGDNVSVMSFPSKDSRPGTPSQTPLVPRLAPGYQPRSESPLRTVTSRNRAADDSFTRMPSRSNRSADNMQAGYTSDSYELSTISNRSCDTRDTSDSTSLLRFERVHSPDPPPSRTGPYV